MKTLLWVKNANWILEVRDEYATLIDRFEYPPDMTESERERELICVKQRIESGHLA